ncbi:MAG: amidase [Deltaproteobacteria bacterium]|nr:amidase [Deltaproteobacteria bacterium]
MDDLLSLSALDQSAQLRSGACTVRALTERYLTRIEAHGETLSCFVQHEPKRALKHADALDANRSKFPNETRSSLWGLPTAMKDLHMVRGMFTRVGSRAFRFLWSPIDDETTRALRQAGMVITGKLATSELAILPVIHTDLHPPTRNPWDLDRYSGGSSGGSSAAVAAGLMPLAVASDGGGSIRIPAAFCGLVGHKPSRGLLPNPFARMEPLGLSVIGPHARSVDDAAALMDVLCSDHAPEGRFLRAVRQHESRKLRVRWSMANPLIETQPEVQRAMHKVLDALKAMGHDVAEGPIFEGSLDEFLPIFAFLANNMAVPFESKLQPSSRWLRTQGKRLGREPADRAFALFTQRIDKWFEGVDLWVSPCVAIDPPRVGAYDGLDGEHVFREAAKLGAYTAVFNVSGHPGTSVPVRVDGHPLPVGVQLLAHRGEDLTTLRVARALLESFGTPLLPWTDPCRMPAQPR